MKSTRRGFGRRALSFGLAIFAAITLTAVGFAAWVLSNNANVDAEGGIKTERFTVDSVKIGKNVWIGANTIILKGTVIGDGSVIGAGSIVKGIIPPGSILVQKRVSEIREIEK